MTKPEDRAPRRRGLLRLNARRIGGGAVAVVVAIIAYLAVTAGFFDREAYRIFGSDGRRHPVAVLLVSGDMGLRYGIGSYTTEAMAARGIEIVGLNSPTLFGVRRTRAELDAIFAGAIRQAMARTGADRIVVIGQSYGADIAQTGMANLPADLRAHVAALMLVVPGRTVYFRADPTNIAYMAPPDSMGADTARTLTWLPVTCIYGDREHDSLCPVMGLPHARIVAMPGGHFLRNDHAGVVQHLIDAMAADVPGSADVPGAITRSERSSKGRG